MEDAEGPEAVSGGMRVGVQPARELEVARQEGEEALWSERRPETAHAL